MHSRGSSTSHSIASPTQLKLVCVGMKLTQA